MAEIRTVRESDLPAFRRLHNRYVGRDESLETVRNWYRELSDLLLGAYDEDSLVGHGLGRPHSDDRLELAGISVVGPHRRQGIGSALLAAFEERAGELGFQQVSLGSAGGDVDQFYLENGYEPESVLVRLDADSSVPETRFEVIEERVTGDTRKLYVDPGAGDFAHLDAVRESFGDSQSIYIVVKSLYRP